MASEVVIVGGGFGGLFTARELERRTKPELARITLVNDVNFVLYTPFLPEAAAGTLEPRHVVTPLRDLLGRTELRLGAAIARDPAAKTITLRDLGGDRRPLRYDQLVIAPGSVSRVLPVPGLAEHAIGFKSLADAIWLRNQLVQRLEEAETGESDDDDPLAFIFVGGGYAGLEALAELQDFAEGALEAYPRVRRRGMRWILVEAADRVLPELNPRLGKYAIAELRRRGIEILLETRLEEVGPDWARISTGETIPTRTVVWTAGVVPHPSIENLGLPRTDRGHIAVDDHLRVPGEDGVWALGDAAAVPDPARKGQFCPPTAQHAVRQGRLAGRNVAAALSGARTRPFRYRSRGAFVNLGRYRAVAASGPLTFTGFFAWWLARTYHVSQIPGLARKVRTVLDWTAGLPFRRDVAEVGTIGHPRPLRADEYLCSGTHRSMEADNGDRARDETAVAS
jgi:NADH dehydrogenase